jgi:hypothetical protein
MDIDAVRAYRDYLLVASDWTQLNDAPITLATQNEWSVYRQKLRDITDDLVNVQWPPNPDFVPSELQ